MYHEPVDQIEPVEHAPAYGWVAASLVLYIVAGVIFKSPVLNWIVGPLWLFGTLYLVPTAIRVLRRRVVDQ